MQVEDMCVGLFWESLQGPAPVRSHEIRHEDAFTLSY